MGRIEFNADLADLIWKWNSTLASTFADFMLWWNLGRILILNLTSSTPAFWFARYNSSTDSARGISYRDNYVLQNFQGLWDGISAQLVCVHVQNQSIWLETKFWYVSVFKRLDLAKTSYIKHPHLWSFSFSKSNSRTKKYLWAGVLAWFFYCFFHTI